ncbi:MAG TPA: ribosome-associated translation inhibitor RaiA [Candidatus Paceibacterota bacterium]
MNINIKNTNIILTPAIYDYVSRRLEAVKKLLEKDSTAKCNLELARTTAHHKNGDIFRAEVHITAKDRDLYASAEEQDLYRAIDVVRDEILREIRSYKSKRISLIRRGGAKIKDIIKGMWPNQKNDSESNL